jgi:ABC-type sugar transport system substrate-binding protein
MTHAEVRRRRGPLVVATALVAVLPLAISACTSQGSTTTKSSSAGQSATTTSGAPSACVAHADAALKPYETIPTTLPSAFTPLSKQAVTGKTLIYIAQSGIPSDQRVAISVEDAGKAAGWTVQVVQATPTVEDLNAKFMQAVGKKPAAIMVEGWPIAAIAQSVAAAKSAGIVVVNAAIADVPTGPPGYAAVSNGPASYALVGNLEADWVLRESNCNAHVAFIGTPYAVFTTNADAFTKTLTTACSVCKSTTSVIQNSNLGTPAQTTAVVSAVQADPSIKYVVLATGDLAAGVAAALTQAGISGVHIIGNSPGNADFAGLRNGTEEMWLTPGGLGVYGWVLFDSLLRVFDTGRAFPGFPQPYTILTKANVPANANQDSNFPANYKTEFRALWKVR